MISGLAIKWVDAAGYLASILVFATFCMRTMIALRLAARHPVLDVLVNALIEMEARLFVEIG